MRFETPKEWAGALFPALILTYSGEIDGVGEVWMARSILTGHVAAGATQARAVECLRRTIVGQMRLAAEGGQSFEEWFGAQRPDEPDYVHQYFAQARERGQRINGLAGIPLAVLPA